MFYSEKNKAPEPEPEPDLLRVCVMFFRSGIVNESMSATFLVPVPKKVRQRGF